MASKIVNLTLNGREIEVMIKPLTTVQKVLRDDLGYTATKSGCKQGGCGSCTVLLNGEPYMSCLLPVEDVAGKEVLTLEGITPANPDEGLHPIQQAFYDKYAIQCGYCSGVCPMKGSMDTLPRKVVRMAQLGLSDRLLEINMYWVCASCQNCGVICPRGIDLPRVMEALRLIILRKKINYIEPSDIAVEAFHKYPQIALVAAFRKSTS